MWQCWCATWLASTPIVVAITWAVSEQFDHVSVMHWSLDVKCSSTLFKYANIQDWPETSHQVCWLRAINHPRHMVVMVMTLRCHNIPPMRLADSEQVYSVVYGSTRMCDTHAGACCAHQCCYQCTLCFRYMHVYSTSNNFSNSLDCRTEKTTSHGFIGTHWQVYTHIYRHICIRLPCN